MKQDINHIDNLQRTALQAACGSGHFLVVELLLEKSADLSIADKDGRTPIYSASRNGYLEVVKLLLEKGADLSVANNYGWTPLNVSSDSGHLEVVKLLLEKGADLFTRCNDGWTPLNAASESGYFEVVKLLLEKGADLSIANNDGMTALYSASSKGHLQVVKLLLEKASIKGHLEVVRFLLEKGADISIADKNGWTALNSASDSGYLEHQLMETLRLFAFFLRSIKLNIYVGIITAVQRFSAPRWEGILELYTKDRYNITPLSSASIRGHEKVSEVLLATDETCIHSSDCFGRTLIWSAKRRRNTQLIKLVHPYAARAGLEIDDFDENEKSEPVTWNSPLDWCNNCTSYIRHGSDYYKCGICDGEHFYICLECF
ncbi:Ankyrin repeat-containing domain protein [Rutstroemia sp. NJR-2017a BBW]|nr:Ankyrin repeat-containing domain protein [Rutstroemia sp. NJR-2017a BBW]